MAEITKESLDAMNALWKHIIKTSVAQILESIFLKAILAATTTLF
jgi:hypothetical protein